MSDTNRPPSPALQDFQGSQRNPFGSEVAAVRGPIGALANAEQQRVIAEVQAQMIMARTNPRDQKMCMDKILNDCTRVSLAEKALYQYGRGGAAVSGPSIRLAEAVAQRWGNLASGMREISRQNGYSECVAYAWDLETGYRDERQFQVRHWRDTKQGGYAVTEERDIYEMIANMGARRKRAALLAVIPGDVIEAAVEECERTLHVSADTGPESLKRVIDAFAEFGVTRAQLEKRAQCRFEAIRPAQLVQLRKIYASLRDGMSEPKEWFEETAWSQADQAAQAAQTQRTGVNNTQNDGGDTQKPAVRKARAQKAAEPPAADPVKSEPEPDEVPFNRFDKEQAAAQQAAHEAPAEPQPESVPHAATEAVEPAPEEGLAAASSGGPAFEFDAWLLDQHGDGIGDDPYDDPLSYIRALDDAWGKLTTANDQNALIEANADGTAAVRQSPNVQANQILNTLLNSNAANNRRLSQPEAATETEAEIASEQADIAAEIPVIRFTMDRGKPQLGPYLKEFQTVVVALSADSFLDFVAANMEVLMAVALSTRALCAKALSTRADELQLPRPTIPLAPITPDTTQDPDWRSAADRIKDMNDCKTVHDLETLARGMIMKAFGDRLKREGKMEIVARLEEAYTTKKKALQSA